ncbi:MAG: arabinogalactan endo-beta-1,4-galactanase [Rariglobus sp.]
MIRLGLTLLLACALATLTRAAAFAKGADVSWLPQMEASGFVFRDADGQPRDCLEILKAHGMDTLRLRVFVNPSDHPRSGHCSRNETVALARRAHRLGFRLLIDFHYSDSWADPGHQTKPAAWSGHSVEQLQQDIFDHTVDVLRALKDQDITPEWVQVGNEITDGLLWPEGRLANGQNLAAFLNAGHRAVKSIDPRIQVIIHLDRGNEPVHFRKFFDTFEKHGTRYDVIGVSYYPYWLGTDYTHTIADLGRNLNDLAARYDKTVMVVEVGGEDKDPANTRALLAAVLKTVRAVPNHRGLGVLYWEPQATAAWSRYKLSCWSADGRPTTALAAFQESPLPSPAP